MLALAIIAAALLAWHAWPNGRARIEFLWLQRKCLTHTWPADTIIFEQLETDTLQTKPGGSATVPPPYWARLVTSHVEVPRGETVYFQSLGTPFLHARTSPNGTRRLVALDSQFVWHRDNTLLRVHVRLLKPGTFARPEAVDVLVTNRDRGNDVSRFVNFNGASFDLARIPYGTAFRLFGGQPDPRDESHFTLDYEADGVRGVIAGWLLDDDAVKLQFRPGPATRSLDPRLRV